MPTRTALDQLLRELRDGAVVATPYSHKSMYFRFEPLLHATVLAVFAIITGVLLGSPPKASGRGRLRS